jgi:hypothetical protein
MDPTKMREAAEAATPGEWILGGVPDRAGMSRGEGLRITAPDGIVASILSYLNRPMDQKLADATHIVASQPTNVLALCDALTAATARAEAAEAERDRLMLNVKQAEYPCSPHCAGYLREQDTLRRAQAAEAERDELRDQVTEIPTLCRRYEAKLRQAREALEMITHNWAGHAEQCASVQGRKCDCDWPMVKAQCDAALTALSAEEAKDGE